MRTLAFDGRTGASGDMLLGALIAAGADPSVLAAVEANLPVRYETQTVTKRGIEATSVDVLADHPDTTDAVVNDEERSGDDDVASVGSQVQSAGDGQTATNRRQESADDTAGHDRTQGQAQGDGHRHDQIAGQSHDAPGEDVSAHSHPHGNEADRGHSHNEERAGQNHPHEHTHAEGHGPVRSYAAVVALVESMDLPPAVERDALAVFERLGTAEAGVHGTALDETAFHEVGADDAIADIVGVCLLVEDLAVEQVVTTPLSTGGGSVSMSHGTYPVPAPAVVEIAERADWSLRGGPVDRELLTPTAAALFAHFAGGVKRLPDLTVSAAGYGAGGYDLSEHPNVLRAIVGESASALSRDAITVLETNIDDTSPELLGGLQEALTDEGALDVTVLPTTMKKSRPGHLVKVVVDPADATRVARRLAEETGTLGVREHGAGHRWVAEREVVSATVRIDGDRYPVAVKVASVDEGDDQQVFDVSAEFDDTLAVARETSLAIREVGRRAEAAVREGRARRLVHVVERERWEGVADGEPYRRPTLDDDGFIHLATPDQVIAVAQTNVPEAEDPVVLVVDPDRAEPEIRYEEQPDGGYAHLYGPLNTDAVVDVLPLHREDGQYVVPEDLR
jgi:uncharacterized protein (TIGR00299 family) protein